MKKNNSSVQEIILSIIAAIVAIAIFLKAMIDLDHNYDVGWYQLPFAARIWGIVPAEFFQADNSIEHRFDGFPLLANFFQGLLWKVTGQIQATNLVGYFSLIIYFLVLRSQFQIPLYLSAIALFSIPAVLTHAPTSMVDLPGNIGVSILIMMTYKFFRSSKLPSKTELIITFLGAAAAVNIKPQLQPLVLVIYCLVGLRLIWLYLTHVRAAQRRLWLVAPLSIIASGLIFFTPIKNLAIYGNPFYPIKIEVAGIVLNHKLPVKAYSEGERAKKWLRSILEIKTPQWSVDQWNQNDDRYLDRGGGFFGAYVVFNLLLLVSLTIREQWQNRQPSPPKKSHDAATALITTLLMSLIPANFPQSHELRYFMFWMITLVSLNLYLITSIQNQAAKWLKPKHLGLVYLLFLGIVLTKIDSSYFKPQFRTLDKYLASSVKPELLKQMSPNARNCLISRHAIIDPDAVPFASIANAFFYSSYFHPEIKHEYKIKVAVDPQGCDDLKVIPPNAQDYIPKDT
ncbi:hypothetical protein [Pleurocapsa sp. PCC 7319]|uniref:hypothetical protein n=1 Tax=Pleurocapsa sp. PCC 7319 TaxID=118161 RepID=UPI00037E0BFE|nr:hypothetical protein [Pleurocapsa sp. PCC 7319]